VLIEADDAEIEQHVEIAKECWRWASERVLKFRMEADSKIVRAGQQYVDDEDGQAAWERLMELLQEVETEGVQHPRPETVMKAWKLLRNGKRSVQS
jgi:hypothetical protein